MRHHRLPITIRSWVCLTLLLWLGAACAPTVPTGKYELLAESSQQLLQGTTDTYSRIEQLQRNFLVATAGSAPLTRDSFQPVVGTESINLTPELRFREDALGVLVNYTELLKALAQEDFEADVDKASAKLAGSLNSLGSTVSSDKDTVGKASGILSTIANTVGRMVVEKKRLSALKSVMDDAQPALNDLSLLFTKSNNKIKQIINIMFDRILAHENKNRPTHSHSDDIDSKVSGKTAEEKAILKDVDRLIDSHRFAYDSRVAREITEVKAILKAMDSLNDGVASFPTAHQEIRNSLDQKAGAKEALQRLVEEGQRVNKFYRSVK